jgi:RNA polymerase sigma factor (sigma-70 family)
MASDPSKTPVAPQAPDDEFLIAGLLAGDAAALRKLIERYDRLVRYTVFRVAGRRGDRDPQWIDSLASDTWTGFVRSLQRDTADRPTSVPAYLVQIARNQSISAIRRTARTAQTASLDQEEQAHLLESEAENPDEVVARLEDLETLRACMAELGDTDCQMAAQLPAITERRWKDAANALGVSESTLRSRWKKILEQLRACVRRKSGKSFAPATVNSDS